MLNYQRVSGMRTRATTSGLVAPLPLSWLPALLFSLVKTQAGSHGSHGNMPEMLEIYGTSMGIILKTNIYVYEINGNQWEINGNQWKSIGNLCFVMFGPCLAWFENETCHEHLWFHGLPDVACFNIQSWQMHVILKLLKHELCLSVVFPVLFPVFPLILLPSVAHVKICSKASESEKVQIGSKWGLVPDPHQYHHHHH